MKTTCTTRRLIALLPCLVLGAAIGCKPLDVRSPIHMANPFTPLSTAKAEEEKREGKEKKKEIEYGTPETMAVIWTDSVYTAPGARPTRGFGGRFFFYDGKGEAIHCEGELTVFGFDDSDQLSQSKIPQKKFVYPAEQLQSHAGMSDLGISYSFWIPWDQAGGDRKAISLLPVLKTPDGRVVRGEATVNVLPGKTPESVHALTSIAQMRETVDRAAMERNRVNGAIEGSEYPVGLVGLDQPTHPGSNVRTATIDVPREMGRNMQQPQAAREPMSQIERPQLPDLSQRVPYVQPAESHPSQRVPSSLGRLNASQPIPPSNTPVGRTPNLQMPNIQMPNAQMPMNQMQGNPMPGNPMGTINQGQMDVPFPTMNYDPSTNTMTGIGPAPGFGTMAPGRSVAGGMGR